jgi:hypothetical protein
MLPILETLELDTSSCPLRACVTITPREYNHWRRHRGSHKICPMGWMVTLYEPKPLDALWPFDPVWISKQSLRLRLETARRIARKWAREGSRAPSSNPFMGCSP